MTPTIPVIRLEVERMRQTMVMALSEKMLQLDVDIQAAVESYCKPEHIASIINAEAERTLDIVIKEEVKMFFMYGEGRSVVAEAVKKRLLEQTTYTPLDEIGPDFQ